MTFDICRPLGHVLQYNIVISSGRMSTQYGAHGNPDSAIQPRQAGKGHHLYILHHLIAYREEGNEVDRIETEGADDMVRFP